MPQLRLAGCVSFLCAMGCATWASAPPVSLDLPALSRDGTRLALPLHEEYSFHGGTRAVWHKAELVRIVPLGQTEGEDFIVRESDARFGFQPRDETARLRRRLEEGQFRNLEFHPASEGSATGLSVAVAKDPTGAKVQLRQGSKLRAERHVPLPRGAEAAGIRFEAEGYVPAGQDGRFVYVRLRADWTTPRRAARVYHHDERTLWVALDLAEAAREPAPERLQPAGGACAYAHFSGTCHLLDVRREPLSGRVKVIARYRTDAPAPTTDGRRLLTHGAITTTLVVRSEDADAAEAGLRAKPDLPCSGEVETTGSCTPLKAQVELP